MRVWLTGRTCSSLNGAAAWRRNFCRKCSDGNGIGHQDRAPTSMEHHFLGRIHGRMRKGKGKETRDISEEIRAHVSTASDFEMMEIIMS